jgi:lysophospholipase L1-like esterase
MINLCKVALGPVFSWQSLMVQRTALRLPEASGPRVGIVGRLNVANPLRILFVGDSTAAGVGVESQGEGLAVQAVQLLSEKIGVPVSWQLIAKSGLNTGEALELVRSSDLQPADVLVTVLGGNDVTDQRSAEQFLSDYKALVDLIVQRAGVQAVVINGLPPVHTMPIMPQPLRWYLGQYARALDAELQQWAQSNPKYSYVPLRYPARPDDFATDRYHPGAALYRRWAELLAESLATHLEQNAPELIADRELPASEIVARGRVELVSLVARTHGQMPTVTCGRTNLKMGWRARLAGPQGKYIFASGIFLPALVLTFCLGDRSAWTAAIINFAKCFDSKGHVRSSERLA